MIRGKLKNKRILITAGPTWIPIDKVRVISNIATGETGILLAEEAKKKGAKVTLLLGPVGDYKLNSSIRVIRFKFFDELKRILKEKLISKEFDILIQTAAVSDYRPKKIYRKKLKSDLNRLNLALVPTEKISNSIKRYDSKIFLVIFKLELDVNKDTLIERTHKLLERTNADLAVGNTFNRKSYKSFILNKDGALAFVRSKEKLAKVLIKEISERV